MLRRRRAQQPTRGRPLRFAAAGFSVAATLHVLSCVPNDGVPPGGPVALDVVVDDEWATVFLSRPDGSCSCSSRFLSDGSCGETFTDVVGCSCDAGRTPATPEQLRGCIEEVHGLDASGAELVGTEHTVGVIGIDGGAAELVVVGCGGTTRVALDGLPRPEPISVDDVRRTGPAAADAAVVVVDASHAQVCIDTGFVEQCCDAPSGRVGVPTGGLFSFGTIRLSAIAGPIEQVEPWGTVRMWRRARRDIGPGVVVPEPTEGGAPGQWTVALRRMFAPISAVFDVYVEQLVFDPDLPDELTFQGGESTFHLGPLEDTIDVDVGGGVHYLGAVAHPPIERRLPLGEIVATEIVVEPIEVTLTRQDDPSETVTGTFEMRGLLPAIARP